MYKKMIFLLFFLPTNLIAENQQHGVTREINEHGIEVWNDKIKKWSSVESFWQQYANSHGGLTWGKATEYPIYNQVKEFDTLLLELPQGLCLMEFFHTRWRRANDVRRWDDAFNQYGGCPFVFD